MRSTTGRPVALDLFCGGGGAALGLALAGYSVVGVDSDPRCAAVYPGIFVCADFRDAIELLLPLERFALVWASPPCQRWTTARNLTHMQRRRGLPPDHVGETRRLIAGHPRAVLENVPGAPIRCDVALTGPAVGLHSLYRRRHFELSWPVPPQPAPRRPAGSVAEGTLVTVTRQGGIADRAIRARRRENIARGLLPAGASPDRFHRREMLAAMGLPDTGMTLSQIGEAVPPRYAARIAELASIHDIAPPPTQGGVHDANGEGGGGAATDGAAA